MGNTNNKVSIRDRLLKQEIRRLKKLRINEDSIIFARKGYDKEWVDHIEEIYEVSPRICILDSDRRVIEKMEERYKIGYLILEGIDNSCRHSPMDLTASCAQVFLRYCENLYIILDGAVTSHTYEECQKVLNDSNSMYKNVHLIDPLEIYRI